MSEPQPLNVLVLGAGVIGLTTAVSILRKHPDYNVTLVAHKWPTDAKNIEYTSLWAGAHHVSTAPDERHQKLDIETFDVFQKMMKEDPESHIMKTISTEYYDFESAPNRGINFLETLYPSFQRLPKEELLDRTIAGCKFETVTIDSPNYLRKLIQEFLKLGGTQVPIPKISSLEQLPTLFRKSQRPDVIINAAGLGNAAWDPDVYPTRGQTVLVRAPWVKDSITCLRDGEVTYIIPRKSGDVILGGTKHDHDWTIEPKSEISKGIKERCLALMSTLIPEELRNKEGGVTIEDLDVIEEGAGLRPSRKGGVRIEEDPKKLDGNIRLIHAYGHGGFGYQSSWGTANEVLRILDGSS